MDASPNDEEKERIIEEMKKERRNILSGILILLMTCAILMTCLSIWMIVTMDVNKSCELKTGSNDTEMNMILPTNHTVWDSCCLKLKQANQNPYLSLDFLAQLMVGGSMLKCRSTAHLYWQAQLFLELEHLLVWAGLALPIAFMIPMYTVHYVYPPMEFERFPHIRIYNEQTIYNLCDVLLIILYFSFAEFMIIVISWFTMHFFQYNDVTIEMEYYDRWNTRGRRENQR